MTAGELDLEYLPGLTVPNATELFDEWARRSAEVRAAMPPAELAYGAGVHEVMDVFSPAAGPARATVLFIHGGYWRAFYKDHFSYLAPALVEAGHRLAVVSYDLAPSVHVTDIVSQVRDAVLHLSRRFAEPLVVTGHSAGGHLAAIVHSTDWATLGADPPRIAAAVGISGLYDLEPLTRTSLQPVVDLTPLEVSALSPARRRPTTDVPFLVALGALESPAFHAQSRDLVAAWPGVAMGPLAVEGCHHFDVCDELLPLTERALNVMS
ncbi:MAG TPA: alpha/beta hydrolase [Intrasporangium sp.]|nr:alpha/beta hydrolase [Intrasporangium sp.]